MCVDNATIGELHHALAAGETTAAALVQAYLARIETYNGAGPRLNAVRAVNPDALVIAAQSDAREPAKRRPLEGIPILRRATAGAKLMRDSCHDNSGHQSRHDCGRNGSTFVHGPRQRQRGKDGG